MFGITHTEPADPVGGEHNFAHAIAQGSAVNRTAGFAQQPFALGAQYAPGNASQLETQLWAPHVIMDANGECSAQQVGAVFQVTAHLLVCRFRPLPHVLLRKSPCASSIC